MSEHILMKGLSDRGRQEHLRLLAESKWAAWKVRIPKYSEMPGARVNRFVRFVCMIVINYNMWIWLLYVLCVGSSTLREGRFFPTGTPFVWLDISKPSPHPRIRWHISAQARNKRTIWVQIMVHISTCSKSLVSWILPLKKSVSSSVSQAWFLEW